MNSVQVYTVILLGMQLFLSAATASVTPNKVFTTKGSEMPHRLLVKWAWLVPIIGRIFNFW